MSFTSCADVVFVDGLQLVADIGPDCWGRTRPQPAIVSIYLHLYPFYLARTGASDDVSDSVNYSRLAKAVSALVNAPGARFSDVRSLMGAITKAAFDLAGGAAAEVRVRVELPKMVLLAADFVVEITTPAGKSSEDVPMNVFVTDLTLAVVIGVNPPEREVKQRVITNIVFHESPRPESAVDYPKIMAEISKNIEKSMYFTLEKFVLEVVRTACLSSDAFQAVTVRAQKPNALTFARSSGVEITRQRSSF